MFCTTFELWSASAFNVRLQFSYLFSIFVEPFNATCSSYCCCKSKFVCSFFFKTKLLAIIVFGPELALYNVFPLLTTNLCPTIAFILLSAYAFYLDQFEIYCVLKSTSIFFTAVGNLIFFINYIDNCNQY